MDPKFTQETLEILQRVENALKASTGLIIEASPELLLKINAISHILSLLDTYSLEKLVFCTNHLQTIEKIVHSLPSLSVKGIILSSKNVFCLQKQFSNLTASDLESNCKAMNNCNTCGYPQSSINLSGILSIKDIKSLCKDAGICPYYLTQSHLESSRIIFCTQDYFLNKGYDQVKKYSKHSVIMFEDAIFLDTCAIDAYSIHLNLKILSEALRGVDEINEKLVELDNEGKLEKYYEDCKTGDLKEYVNQEISYRSVLSDGVLGRPVPGNIRKTKYFAKALKIVIVYLRQSLRAKDPTVQSAYGFLHKLTCSALIEISCLNYFSLLFNTFLQASNIKLSPNLLALSAICNFCTLVSASPQVYALIYEPYPINSSTLNPVLQLSLQTPTALISPILSSFSSALLFTSSCSPIDLFQNLLGINYDFISTSHHSNLCPLILTKGSDQVSLSTKAEEKSDDSIMRNYGEILLELCDVIPDGIIAYFPEWSILETYVIKWNESGLIYRLLDNRIVFIESPGNEFKVLNNFLKACESGRGAVLLAVSRGKAIKDLHIFAKHVKGSVMFGVPQPDALSRVLKSRLLYLKERAGVDESEYLNFDAMRQALLCVSQSLRAEARSSVMIFADKRFESLPKKNKIPKWILEGIKGNINVSTDVAKSVALKFLKTN